MAKDFQIGMKVTAQELVTIQVREVVGTTRKGRKQYQTSEMEQVRITMRGLGPEKKTRLQILTDPEIRHDLQIGDKVEINIANRQGKLALEKKAAGESAH
ncbi:MAG: hypothetical protein RI885_2296 [Actinomycetota bacterium]|jgi:hypothetical protein